MILLFLLLMENTPIFLEEVGFHLEMRLIKKQDMDLDLILCNLQESDIFVRITSIIKKLQLSIKEKQEDKFMKILQTLNRMLLLHQNQFKIGHQPLVVLLQSTFKNS